MDGVVVADEGEVAAGTATVRIGMVAVAGGVAGKQAETMSRGKRVAIKTNVRAISVLHLSCRMQNEAVQYAKDEHLA
jgi:hypothetical protein